MLPLLDQFTSVGVIVNDLKLFLLGRPRLEREGRSVVLNRSRAMALLAYLAVTGERHSRELLATLLWPESEPSRGRARLRRELATLNDLLGKGWLETDREQIGLTGSAGQQMWLDVAAFQESLVRCQQHDHPVNEACPECLPPLCEAVALYRGSFLAGFSLPDSPEFDEWQFFQAEEQRQAFASALERLVRLLSSQGDYESALPYARRWLALDSLHEPAHCQLMQLYACTGQWTAALRQYSECEQVLKAELGVSPSAETAALYEAIKTKQLVSPVGLEAWRDVLQEQRPHPSPRPRVRGQSTPAQAQAVQNWNNLPPQTTLFIGREKDLADIQRLLLNEADCRLLTLVGPGGIGKTRLALAVAAQTLDAFPDGTYFVSLASVSEVEFIVPTIAEVLHFTLYGSTDPKDQLLDYLSQKQLLLIVDNFEHLLDGVDLLSNILSQAPGVTLLATSRERLHLQEEWSYEVQGMAYPHLEEWQAGRFVLGIAQRGGSLLETDAILQASGQAHSPDLKWSALQNYSAVQLFLQRARRAEASFAPSAEEMADIVRVCQLVDGMPLGLELAAPWIRTLSCREIAAEIERSLDFLTTTLRNVPERHRSLRVVFEQTWRRLSVVEQTVLMQLSVFRGGCTREAAEQVTGAMLPVLSSLVDKALLRRTNTGRYELHELIRQFAESQLQTDPLGVEQTQQRHQDYFFTFLETRTAGVKGARQKETLVEIKADIDNRRLAWRRAVADRDAQAIERAAECLFVYYLYSSGQHEGQAAFQQTAAAFIEGPEVLPDPGLLDNLIVLDKQENLVGFLLAGQGFFLARTHDPYAAQTLLEHALALLRRVEPHNRRKEAFALLWLGWALNYQGRFVEAQECVEASLPLFSEAADPWGEGWSLLLWGNSASDNRPAEAEEVLQRALTACRKSGDQAVLGYVSHNLAFVATGLGQYTHAKQYVDQATRIFEELDNKLGLGYAFQRRGELAIPEGEYEQAIQTLQQAIAYYTEVRTPGNIVKCQYWLGTAFRLQGDHHQAEQLYRQALAGATAVNHQMHIALCLFGLSCVAYDRGELHRAEQLQQEVLAIAQQQELESLMADTLGHLGSVLVAAGAHRRSEAGRHFQQALELAIKHQVAPIALDVYVRVAQLWVQTGDVERAVELLTLAEQHEASTFETREKARHNLTEWMDRLPPEVLQATQTRSRTLDWQIAVRRLIEALSAQEQ